ncbi:hypothetical protein TOT_020000975 [Theileria orientalis strain Shintoku]|uniref:Uncharacterized protein n=1 Tax=Theileria orientalis strain Shintoku TaxID=869250 RepID=J4D8D4_THEOR|nr:hypothetical protein TOT_020000975 [Theileria orientalis strain Shintoku]PVC51698.1 hypothetical protein MACL_00001360 [Theileria orientalis]BAM40720.1 hypothetical protein TOT_020000975 [Theileria orientalis strain Shintoku]|eukprot:XP_009691021.1 hypothetical protein TOT_020000975 [Theileria orientalis strain Shintoku]
MDSEKDRIMIIEVCEAHTGTNNRPKWYQIYKTTNDTI